jgi:diphthine-ammonia ligase
MKPRAAVSWSGGKDSYLALHRSRSSYDVVALVTMFSEDGARSRSHGLRPEILQAQAERLGLPICKGRGSWASYEDGYLRALEDAHALGISHVIFGDIMYDANREFPERVCAATGLTAVEPLWGEPTDRLYREFVLTGADARIVTVRESVLDQSWLGRRLTIDLLAGLEAAGSDPCGEHGEYHTVVIDAPAFSSPIDVATLECVSRGGCWALDLCLDERSPSTSHAAGV